MILILHDIDTKNYGGSLIAVKNIIDLLELNHNFPDSCLACKVKLNDYKFDVCVTYNLASTCKYRYNEEYFKK